MDGRVRLPRGSRPPSLRARRRSSWATRDTLAGCGAWALVRGLTAQASVGDLQAAGEGSLRCRHGLHARSGSDDGSDAAADGAVSDADDDDERAEPHLGY